jgi:hypothetical protein
MLSFAMRTRIALKCWLIMTATTLAVLGTFTALGQNVMDSAAGVDGCFTNIERWRIIVPVSEVLHLDRSFVEKALVEKELKVSELVCIKAIAAKTAQPPEEILMTSTNRDWLVAIKAAGIKEQDLVQQLDDAYADLALKALDLPKKKPHRHHEK